MSRKQRTKEDYEELPKRLGNSRRLQVDGEVKKMAPGKRDEWWENQMGWLKRKANYLVLYGRYHKLIWGRINRAIPNQDYPEFRIVWLDAANFEYYEQSDYPRLHLYEMMNGDVVEVHGALSWKEYRRMQYR